MLICSVLLSVAVSHLETPMADEDDFGAFEGLEDELAGVLSLCIGQHGSSSTSLVSDWCQQKGATGPGWSP